MKMAMPGSILSTNLLSCSIDSGESLRSPMIKVIWANMSFCLTNLTAFSVSSGVIFLLKVSSVDACEVSAPKSIHRAPALNNLGSTLLCLTTSSHRACKNHIMSSARWRFMISLHSSFACFPRPKLSSVSQRNWLPKLV